MFGYDVMIGVSIGVIMIVILAIISGISIKDFAVYENSGVYEVVKMGWSWPAFFFWWIWALIKRLWLVGISFLVIVIILAISAHELITSSKLEIDILASMIKLLVMIIFGAMGNSWIENKLKANGFRLVGTVTAKNVDQAKILAAQIEVDLENQDAETFGSRSIKESRLPIEPVSTTWYIYGHSGPLAGTVVELTTAPLIIGRNPKECNLIIPSNWEISRRHCILRFDNESKIVLLEDCGSKNGTFLSNGRRLEAGSPYPLKNGDCFYLAEPDILFEIRNE